MIRVFIYWPSDTRSAFSTSGMSSIIWVMKLSILGLGLDCKYLGNNEEGSSNLKTGIFLCRNPWDIQLTLETFCDSLFFCGISRHFITFPKDLLLITVLSFTSQGANMAKQIGAATYIECSALQSENSVRDIFHVATLACVNKTNKNVKRNKSQRATKRISHMPSRPELSAVATDLRKDKAKSCTVMWISLYLQWGQGNLV